MVDQIFINFLTEFIWLLADSMEVINRYLEWAD